MTALNNPFFQVALPIMVTMLVASWLNSKGFDGIHKRLDDMAARLIAIEGRLLLVETRLGGVEAKAWR